MVVSATPQLRFVEFTLNQFPAILDLPFPEEKPGKDATYTAVSLSELEGAEDEVSLCRFLLGALKGDQDIEVSEDKLLLVKSKASAPKDVYGATIYRESLDNDNLVIKFGNNLFPCTFDLNTRKIKAGRLEGKFKFIDKETLDKVPYQKLVAHFNTPDNRFLIYVFGVQVQKGLNLSEPVFDAAIESEQGITQFLQVPNTEIVFENTPAFNMGDLEVGDYEIEAITRGKLKEPKKGVYCYFLNLVGGAKVFASNGSFTQLTQTDKEIGTEANFNWAKRVVDKSGKVKAPCFLRVRNKRSYKNRDGQEAFTADSQILPGVPKSLSPEMPIKQIEQASEASNQVALPTSTLSFANQGQAIAWATEQGLTEAEAKTLLLRVNPKSSKQEREVEFVTMVGEILRDTIQGGNGNTITVDAVASELDEDDIPG